MRILSAAGSWSILLLLLSVVRPAVAQSPEPEKDKTASATGYIEEVIVTVTKRSVSLQEVAASVTALDGDLIDRANITSPFKLAEMVPGVIARGRENLSIRGISVNLTGPSPVAFHENGLFIFNNNLISADYYDLAGIELLRGPSGTVYGRNATAGALNLKWRPPAPAWEAKADARAADLGERRYRAAINAPLLPDDWLNARVVYVEDERDGLLDNLIAERERFDGDIRDNSLGRVWLQSRPTDNLTLDLRYKHFERDQFRIASATDLTRRNGSLEELGARPLPADRTKVRARAHEMIFSEQAQALFGDRSFDDYEVTQDRLDVELNWSLGEIPLVGSTDLAVLAGRGSDDNFRALDIDGTEATIVDRVQEGSDDTGVLELRLTSSGAATFNWILGYFRADLEREERALNFVRANIDLGGASTVADLDVSTPFLKEELTSEAAFFSGDLSLRGLWSGAPDLELFGGVRINRDEQRLRERSVIELLLPDRENRVTGVTVTDATAEFKIDFDEPTGELGARWFASDEHMLYGKLARGYKNGFGEVRDDGSVNEVEAEVLDAFELGSKNRFFGGRLQLNAVAFHYDYSNLQVQQVIGTETVTENAARAELSGLEIDLDLNPAERWFARLAAGWLKGTFEEFCSPDPAFPDRSDPGCAPGEQDLSGNDLQDAPRFKISALLDYTRPLGAYGRLQFVVKSTWTDDYFLRHFNREDVDRLESFTDTDLRLIWTGPGGRFSVDAFVENLEDEDQIFFRSIPLGLGVDGVITGLGPNEPRLMGVKLAYRLD